jgi:hypothetical protein
MTDESIPTSNRAVMAPEDFMDLFPNPFGPQWFDPRSRPLPGVLREAFGPSATIIRCDENGIQAHCRVLYGHVTECVRE